MESAVEWLYNKMLYIDNEYDMKLITKSEYQFKRRDIIEQAKEMEAKQKIDTTKVNRVEVIQHSDPHNGRAYTKYNATDVEIQFQDTNKTLKIFLK